MFQSQIASAETIARENFENLSVGYMVQWGFYSEPFDSID